MGTGSAWVNSRGVGGRDCCLAVRWTPQRVDGGRMPGARPLGARKAPSRSQQRSSTGASVGRRPQPLSLSDDEDAHSVGSSMPSPGALLGMCDVARGVEAGPPSVPWPLGSHGWLCGRSPDGRWQGWERLARSVPRSGVPRKLGRNRARIWTNTGASGIGCCGEATF